MSTLADLQRRNLAKMESTELQEAKPQQVRLQETRVPTPSNVSLTQEASNDGMMETPFDASLNQSNDDLNEGLYDGTITPSSVQGVKPSRARLNKDSPEEDRPAEPKPKVSKPRADSAAGLHLKDALDAQLRAHLMEQLMPAAGKEPVTRLNVEMPEDLHQRLKQHCVKTRTPIKALINALIALYLEDEGAT